MRQAVIREAPDRIFHLGDMLRDAWALEALFPDIPLERVPGNCDYSDLPVQRCIALAEKKILMTHGHTYHVKAGPGAAIQAALELGVDVLLFGHTHQPLCDCRGKLWVMNPGSVRRGFQPTYGIIHLKNGKLECRIQTVEGR